ncbi:MAG: sigma-54 dependent transcriptional regulator [Firmicutes bacterium]|nr:sigma-54 dependent transcriptional regulator [Bacillota bacterium]MDH7495893.1 sigma-54 dependent transcriptional regulator [Bacillota bacterium]
MRDKGDAKKATSVLIVDDDEGIRETLEAVLSEEGYEVAAAGTGRDALELARGREFHLVLLDLRMPDMSGLEILPRLRSELPRTPVIIMTAYGTIKTAVEAVKQGAYDFVSKPFDLDEMRITIEKALAHERLKMENERLRTMLEDELAFQEIVGRSGKMRAVFELIRRVMNHDVTVLIVGESGTGKELVAKAIHCNSPRRAGPFLKVNCAALPDPLLESELFGYEKGAFTGAQTRKPGRFELADGGTLFLDEIGNMSPSMQVKLLRVLQEREFERVGGKSAVKVDVRILAATNANLKSEVARGAFREDLYYRLNVVQIHVPPLRERKEDIPLLVQHFIKEFNVSLGKEFAGVSPQAMNCLTRYDWPGNVRELKNAIEAAMLLGEGPFIMPEHLPEEVADSGSDTRGEHGQAARGGATAAAQGSAGSSRLAQPTQPAPWRTGGTSHGLESGPRASATGGSPQVPAGHPSSEPLEAVEREHILRVLRQCSWNQSKAAWVLGVHRNTLRKKIRDYKLTRSEP